MYENQVETLRSAKLFAASIGRKMVNRLFLIFLFIVVVSLDANATESVYCDSKKAQMYVYYNISESSYAGLWLLINNKEIESPDWETEKIRTDWNRLTILLQVIDKNKKRNRTLHLKVNKQKGELKYGGRVYKVTCDWFAFFDEKELKKLLRR